VSCGEGKFDQSYNLCKVFWEKHASGCGYEPVEETVSKRRQQGMQRASFTSNSYTQGSQDEQLMPVDR
jgi:hypothetical protein